MNVVVWARVSSREQKEGYSIDAQLRANRDRAEKNGWRVIREFVVAESAKRGAERVAFNEMYRWVRANAKREKIKAILSHKLDRVYRNMRDAVRLQELEDECGVQLAFVENQFGPGAAGALSFNVMAAVAQYYSDNLRSEVLKGMDEKVRQGWPTGLAPYGYLNVNDREQPIQPHPARSKSVIRIFELYAGGNMTLKSLADRLENEGHVFRNSQPRFNRTTLAWILNNRFYIGELRRNGQVFEGKYKRLIDRATFDACQDIMQGRNRRFASPNLPLSGGLFRCAYCGQAITGERIRRKLANGSINEHVYYRCGNDEQGPGHPKVRWKAQDLEHAVVTDLARLRIPSREIANWFRKALKPPLPISRHTSDSNGPHKRKSELAAMQDRLLNVYLTGGVDEQTFQAKSAELKSEALKVQEAIEALGDVDPTRGDAAIAVFDWSQNGAEIWRGSNSTQRRDILDSVSLNRTLSDVTLVTTKRKPFDILAEGLPSDNSRGDWIRTSDLLRFNLSYRCLNNPVANVDQSLDASGGLQVVFCRIKQHRLHPCALRSIVIIFAIVAHEQNFLRGQIQAVQEMCKELRRGLAPADFRANDNRCQASQCWHAMDKAAQASVEVRSDRLRQTMFAASGDHLGRVGFDRPRARLAEDVPKRLETRLGIGCIIEHFADDLAPALPLARFIRAPAGVAIDLLLTRERGGKSPSDFRFIKPAAVRAGNLHIKSSDRRFDVDQGAYRVVNNGSDHVPGRRRGELETQSTRRTQRIFLKFSAFYANSAFLRLCYFAAAFDLISKSRD